ncbi:CBS domain-containing protein [Roseomonas nepalensis]|uniref:CBS domain-containing protein n=1 Tax=Muricoccus nepalensis TaxID=1854500 RepID=A0A502F9G9_9PROT|nr:CBS domain-containing protein [Roseomonas nepalensis]TPG46020.1 CBS domain-containing protein [Roseomonas nepalensis]
MAACSLIDIARDRLLTIDAAAPLEAAAAIMSKPNSDLIVVCDADGSMVGVLTKRDMFAQIARRVEGGRTSRVDTIMKREVVSCASHGSVSEIWKLIVSRNLQRIPMIDHSQKPIGIVYARDVLLRMLDIVENEEALLRDYVMNVGYQ